MTFHAGDRVVCKVDTLQFINIYSGDTGVICCEKREPGSGMIRVRWDNKIGGHDCGSYCEYGYGWNVRDNEIVILNSEDDKDEANAACSDEELVALLF